MVPPPQGWLQVLHSLSCHCALLLLPPDAALHRLLLLQSLLSVTPAYITLSLLVIFFIHLTNSCSWQAEMSFGEGLRVRVALDPGILIHRCVDLGMSLW